VKCQLCEREAVFGLCLYHQAAKEKVEATYPLWVKAYGKIEWKDYLDNVKRNPQTGRWAKEVAGLMEAR
jgi:hypothetical protein